MKFNHQNDVRLCLMIKLRDWLGMTLPNYSYNKIIFMQSNLVLSPCLLDVSYVNLLLFMILKMSFFFKGMPWINKVHEKKYSSCFFSIKT